MNYRMAHERDVLLQLKASTIMTVDPLVLMRVVRIFGLQLRVGNGKLPAGVWSPKSIWWLRRRQLIAIVRPTAAKSSIARQKIPRCEARCREMVCSLDDSRKKGKLRRASHASTHER